MQVNDVTRNADRGIDYVVGTMMGACEDAGIRNVGVSGK